jgi:hypothetical protein
MNVWPSVRKNRAACDRGSRRTFSRPPASRGESSFGGYDCSFSGSGSTYRPYPPRRQTVSRHTGLSGPLRALDITSCGSRCTISDAVSTIRTCRWTNEPPAPIFVPGSPRVVRHDRYQRGIRIRVVNPWLKSPSLEVLRPGNSKSSSVGRNLLGRDAKALCDRGKSPLLRLLDLAALYPRDLSHTSRRPLGAEAAAGSPACSGWGQSAP